MADEELVFWAPIISKVTPAEYTVFIQGVQEDKAELATIKEVLEKERDYTRKLTLNFESLEKKYKILEEENNENRAQAETYKALYEHVKPTFADKVVEKASVGAAIFAVLWVLTQ